MSDLALASCFASVTVVANHGIRIAQVEALLVADPCQLPAQRGDQPRDPSRRVVFLNYSAVDPVLTNEKCSYWHFRFDAHADMRMTALMSVLREDAALKNIYLIGQDYSFGQAVLREARRQLGAQRPDVQIVGDELHPPFQGHDFTAHARSIQASGAQALATGNWGADLRDLVKALHKQGVYLPIYAYYPALKGVPEALAETGGRLPVYQVAYNHSNQAGPIQALATAFRKQYAEDLTIYASYDGIEMLSHAMAHVGSTDPARVAGRLSGMIFKGFNGPVHLRADDHQLLKGLYVSRWQKVDATHPRSAEETGYTFAPVQYMDAAQISGPTRCQMQRP